MKSALETTDVSAVQDSAKTEFNSYSDAVKSNLSKMNSFSDLNEATLWNVVKSVVKEEDRSRNLMIFGLPEN